MESAESLQVFMVRSQQFQMLLSILTFSKVSVWIIACWVDNVVSKNNSKKMFQPRSSETFIKDYLSIHHCHMWHLNIITAAAAQSG